MTISSTMLQVSRIALAVVVFNQGAWAQEVRIIGRDGSIDLSGTLLSSDDGILRLATPIGEVTVEQSKVLCEGLACPTAPEFDYAFSVAGPGDVAEVLIPILFDGYATDNDAEIVLLDRTGFPVDEEAFAFAMREGLKAPLRMIDYDGEEVASYGIQQAAGAVAFDLLATNDVEIVFSERPAAPEETARVSGAGGGDITSFEQELVVAVDGLAIIAHPDNELESITVPQVAAIFGGQITNWSQIGGPNAPLNLYAFAPGSDEARDAENLLLDPFDYTLAESAQIVRTTQELTAAVTQDPNAIAAVSYHNKRATRAIPLSNECGIIVPASPFSIKTEEYPLERRVVAYNRADSDAATQDFLQHISGTGLDGLVSKAGFIDLSIVTENEDYAVARREIVRNTSLSGAERALSAGMIAEMERSARLSTTFRFAPGSSVLDNKARRDLSRMVAYVGREKPAAVYVVGFADAAGPFSENQRLSEQRARQVAEQLSASATGDELDGVRLEVRGYSELAPVACNESFEGRAINRRVEIWVQR